LLKIGISVDTPVYNQPFKKCSPGLPFTETSKKTKKKTPIGIQKLLMDRIMVLPVLGDFSFVSSLGVRDAVYQTDLGAGGGDRRSEKIML
jgi:hypothetical protein